MGQVNSCDFHCLRTNHSEEGYCVPCDQRFSTFRGRGRDRNTGDENEELFDELVKVVSSNPDKKKGLGIDLDEKRNEAIIHNRSRYALQPDPIYRCEFCPRFFFVHEVLVEHVTSDECEKSKQTRTCSGYREAAFCAICKRSYPCSILQHLDAALKHIQMPTISRMDEEIERAEDCCVRCGIYFKSKEQKRKHFRDVEHHILHVQAEVESLMDSEGNCDPDSADDIGYVLVEHYPTPPSTMPGDVQATRSDHNPFRLSSSVTGKQKQAISLSSSYVPELKRQPFGALNQLPLAARFGSPSSVNAGPSASTNSSAQTNNDSSITDEFECPLCLENETDIASLPCGHLFGTACIYKTLDSDFRCPLCRTVVDRRSVRRVYSA